MATTTRRERLEQARDALSEAIDACESKRDLPALVREYRATLAEIDALPIPQEVSDADEIAARRAARRSGSSGKTRSKRSV
jgi:hypothetical protein